MMQERHNHRHYTFAIIAYRYTHYLNPLCKGLTPTVSVGMYWLWRVLRKRRSNFFGGVAQLIGSLRHVISQPQKPIWRKKKLLPDENSQGLGTRRETHTKN